MVEFIKAIHTCANVLHELHIAVKDVAVHKLFDEWYKHMYDDYDNFVEWAKIKNKPIAHTIQVVDRGDMTVEEAYKEAAGMIAGVMVIGTSCIAQGNDSISCGIRSDIEDFCSYWCKVSMYLMRG